MLCTLYKTSRTIFSFHSNTIRQPLHIFFTPNVSVSILFHRITAFEPLAHSSPQNARTRMDCFMLSMDARTDYADCRLLPYLASHKASAKKERGICPSP